MSCPKTSGNSLAILNGHGVIPITPVNPDMQRPILRIDLDGAVALLSEEEGRWVRGIIASRGPNKGCLRASRPDDPVSAYLWRRVAFDLVRNGSGRKPILSKKAFNNMDQAEQKKLKGWLEDIVSLVEANIATMGGLPALPAGDNSIAEASADFLAIDAAMPVVASDDDRPAPASLPMNSPVWSSLGDYPRYQEETAATIERMERLLSAARDIPAADQQALRWLATYYAAGITRTGPPADERMADALGAWSAQIAFEEMLRAKVGREMSDAGVLFPMVSALQLSPLVARDFGRRRSNHARTQQWWVNIMAQNGRLAAYLPLLRGAIGRDWSDQGWNGVVEKSAELLAAQPMDQPEISADELWDRLTDEPTMVILTGLVGSGKTTLASNLIGQMQTGTAFMASLDNVVKQMAETSGYSYREYFDNRALSNKANRQYIRQVMNWMQRAPQLVIFDRMHLDPYSRIKTLELFKQSVDRARRSGHSLPDYRRVVISMLQTEKQAERNCSRKVNEELPDQLTQNSIARMQLPLYGERPLYRRPGLHPTYDAILYAVPGKNGKIAFRGALPHQPPPEWWRDAIQNP